MTNNYEQPTANEPPFWYIVWLADEFHLSMKEAKECARREAEQERKYRAWVAKAEEVKP